MEGSIMGLQSWFQCDTQWSSVFVLRIAIVPAAFAQFDAIERIAP